MIIQDWFYGFAVGEVRVRFLRLIVFASSAAFLCDLCGYMLLTLSTADQSFLTAEVAEKNPQRAQREEFEIPALAGRATIF